MRGMKNRGWADAVYAIKTGLHPSDLEGKYPVTSLIESLDNKTSPVMFKLARFGDIPILKLLSPIYIFRFLKATDLFFRGGAMEAALARYGVKAPTEEEYAKYLQAAVDDLESQGLKVKADSVEAHKRAIEMMDEETASTNAYVFEQAYQDSMASVFTQKPKGLIGKAARMIGSFSDSGPLAALATKPIVPFTNVVANVFNEQLNFTPIGFLRQKFGGEEWMVRDVDGQLVEDKTLLNKAVMGTALTSLIALLAVPGDDDDDDRPFFAIYGAGPRDPEKAKVWKENGNRPWSIRIGDTVLNYLVTPFALGFGAIGQWYDYLREAKEHERETGVAAKVDLIVDVAAGIIGSVFASTLNQSFLSGVPQFAEIANSRDPGQAFKNFAQSTVSSAVTPGYIREFFTSFNIEAGGITIASTKQYEAKTFIGSVFRNMPMVGPSINLPALNRWGEPIDRNRTFVFGRFVGKSVAPDPVYEIAVNRGIDMPGFRGTNRIGKAQMSYTQTYEFIQEAGKILKTLDKQSELAYKTLPKEEAEALMVRNRNIAAKRARAIVRQRWAGSAMP
jgi:hypothetical protein